MPILLISVSFAALLGGLLVPLYSLRFLFFVAAGFCLGAAAEQIGFSSAEQWILISGGILLGFWSLPSYPRTEIKSPSQGGIK